MVSSRGTPRPGGRIVGGGQGLESPPTQPAQPEWNLPTWEDIVRTHSARVYRLAYRLTGNPHDAEDLTQEVFVRVFRSLSSYTPGHVRRLAAPHHHQPVPRLGPAQAADPVRGAGRRDGSPAARLRAHARPGLRRQSPGRRCAGRAEGASAGVPGRGGAVRHRGLLVRGDRRHPGRQAGHGAQPDSPRARSAARRARAPQAAGRGAKAPTPPGSATDAEAADAKATDAKAADGGIRPPGHRSPRLAPGTPASGPGPPAEAVG